jgi:hypothetical protein
MCPGVPATQGTDNSAESILFGKVFLVPSVGIAIAYRSERPLEKTITERDYPDD